MEVDPNMGMLREVSVFVDELANVPHDIRAPYVGLAAFTHKGGLHVHAVQKLARTYEHVDPSLVGNRQTIVVSDMSGQTNILMKARDLGSNWTRVRRRSHDFAPDQGFRGPRLRIRGRGRLL